ncbi:MAG: hypothetical protein AAF989_12770 [Planctomycetota bacterium]
MFYPSRSSGLLPATFAGLVVALSTSASWGAVVFTEATDGDASNSGGLPTVITLAAGDNEIIGSTGANDRDHFTFTIGANETVTSFFVNEFSGSGNHFFGVSEGTTLPTAGNQFLIADLISANETPFNVLGAPGGTFGGMGVPNELGPGSYTVLFNETAGGTFNYRANIAVTAVPEPSTAGVALLFTGCIWAHRRRRRRG